MPKRGTEVIELTYQCLPSFFGWKGNVDSFFQSSTQGLVNVPWEICGGQDHDYFSRLFRDRGHSIHLNQKFRFDSTRSLMLRFRASTTAQGIDLIDENSARSVESSLLTNIRIYHANHHENNEFLPFQKGFAPTFPILLYTWKSG